MSSLSSLILSDKGIDDLQVLGHLGDLLKAEILAHPLCERVALLVDEDPTVHNHRPPHELSQQRDLLNSLLMHGKPDADQLAALLKRNAKLLRLRFLLVEYLLREVLLLLLLSL